MNKKHYDKILDSTEQLAIQMFVDNEIQFNAVKKVLLFKVRDIGVEKPGEAPHDLATNFAFEMVSNFPTLSNEELGKDIRAKFEGARIIENAFDAMKTYKKPEKVAEKKVNEAR